MLGGRKDMGARNPPSPLPEQVRDKFKKWGNRISNCKMKIVNLRRMVTLKGDS